MAGNGSPVTEAETVATYGHHRIGTVHAVAAGSWWGDMRSRGADWVAATPAGRLLGYVVDTRADAGGQPSPEMPADDDVSPFDAFDRAGRFIVSTHSLRGALLAIGNRN